MVKVLFHAQTIDINSETEISMTFNCSTDMNIIFSNSV